MSRMDLCSVLSIPPYGNISAKFGMVWRFLPMADPFVDFMVSRDLDSRYNKSFMYLSIFWQNLTTIKRFQHSISSVISWNLRKLKIVKIINRHIRKEFALTIDGFYIKTRITGCFFFLYTLQNKNFAVFL